MLRPQSVGVSGGGRGWALGRIHERSGIGPRVSWPGGRGWRAPGYGVVVDL